ncbi:hypothetical protein M0R72_19240 [Candidatus Pacearchaeota archaeon]|jgi:hypothetical protein|nr:hypothetical protein [Candidatus Pacearchaeota archaeon]
MIDWSIECESCGRNLKAILEEDGPGKLGEIVFEPGEPQTRFDPGTDDRLYFWCARCGEGKA